MKGYKCKCPEDRDLINIINWNGSCADLEFDTSMCYSSCHIYDWCTENSIHLGAREDCNEQVKKAAIAKALSLGLITEEDVFDNEL